MSASIAAIDAAQLLGSPWLPVACPPGLVDAWRQVHYAAQVVSEVGKSWIQPRADDSHSNLGFCAEGRQARFESALTETDPRFRARLDARALALSLVTADGVTQDRFDCAGRTLAEAMAWVAERAAEIGGPPRQPAIPAPDLPDHPVGKGARFDTADTAAFEVLANWYANVDCILFNLKPILPGTEGPRCWPHHFDHATLSIVRRDPQGGMTATIGVGLTPPDALDDRGYWYVAPWTQVPPEDCGPWPDLPAGRWVERPGSMPIGVLALPEIGDFAAEAQQRVVAGFIAAAVNACSTRLV